jgi:hypothetical protein
MSAKAEKTQSKKDFRVGLVFLENISSKANGGHKKIGRLAPDLSTNNIIY